MKRIIRDNGDEIAFYVKLFPLSIHPGAYEKAEALICDKSPELLEDAYSGKPLPPPSCETRAIDENIVLARELGISSTPTLILSDGTKVVGVKEPAALVQLIEAAGQQAALPPPTHLPDAQQGQQAAPPVEAPPEPSVR
jgi:thiol:disulfide interchange protein DsbC